jgi:hypothetical protein
MIQSKELRIGNFLYGADDSYVDRENKIAQNVFKVCLIGDGVVKLDIGFDAVQRYEDKPLVSYSLNDLKPIPLTEDWLLRFGFVKNDYKYVYSLNSSNFVEAIFNYDLEGNDAFDFFIKQTSIDGGEYIQDLVLINTSYYFVHQLQNLIFALTQKELEIKETA